MNKLYILRPVEGLVEGDNPWNPWYDKCFGFVINAGSAKQARRLAHANAGEENRGRYELDETYGSDTKSPWLEAKYSTCRELKATNKVDVVMQDRADA